MTHFKELCTYGLLFGIVLQLAACQESREEATSPSGRRGLLLEPLQWLRTNSIVYSRFDQFLTGGVGHIACDSTGLYRTDEAGASALWRQSPELCDALVPPNHAKLSRDGRTLLYVSAAAGGAISAMNLDDLSSTTLTRRCTQWWTEVAWSPDDTAVVFTGSCDADETGASLYVMNRNGSRIRQVGKPLGSTTATGPSWAPDGRSVALSLGNSQSERAVVIVDTESEMVRVVGEGYAPVWAPDGQWIAYLRGGVDQDSLSLPSIHLVRATGTEDRVVLQPTAQDTSLAHMFAAFMNQPLIWSPDGERLAFGMGHGIWTVRRDGRDLREHVTREENAARD